MIIKNIFTCILDVMCGGECYDIIIMHIYYILYIISYYVLCTGDKKYASYA
jgi:hypothetical protein